jgi:hypothetical protein
MGLLCCSMFLMSNGKWGGDEEVGEVRDEDGAGERHDKVTPLIATTSLVTTRSKNKYTCEQ